MCYSYCKTTKKKHSKGIGSVSVTDTGQPAHASLGFHTPFNTRGIIPTPKFNPAHISFPTSYPELMGSSSTRNFDRHRVEEWLWLDIKQQHLWSILVMALTNQVTRKYAKNLRIRNQAVERNQSYVQNI